MLNFNWKVDRRLRLNKAYVGKDLIPGTAYNILMHKEMKGIYAIKVSPLGDNFCLLEELEEGYIEDFIGKEVLWWNTWFSEFKKWDEGMIDDSRDVWIKVYGVSVHVWESNFFMSFDEVWHSFICVDENTTSGKMFDVAWILLKVPSRFIFPKSIHVKIDDKVFILKIREDVSGQFCHGAGISKSHSDYVYSEPEDIGSNDFFEEDVVLRSQSSDDSIEQFFYCYVVKERASGRDGHASRKDNIVVVMEIVGENLVSQGVTAGEEVG